MQVVIYRATWHNLQPQAQNFSLNRFLIFSPKKFLLFQEMELSIPNIFFLYIYILRPKPSKFFPKRFFTFFKKRHALKKVLIFSQKSFSNFQKTELSYIFLIKIFLKLRGRCIHNIGIYSEP